MIKYLLSIFLVSITLQAASPHLTLQFTTNGNVVFPANGVGSWTNSVLVAQDKIDGKLFDTDAYIGRLLSAMANDVVNIKNKGANGIGSGDDTLAIQRALNGAEGKLIFLPDGSYPISTGLTLSINNSVFIGRGKIYPTTPAVTTLLTVTSTNSTVTQLRLDGKNLALRGIDVRPTSSDLTFNDLQLNDFYQTNGVTTAPASIIVRGAVTNIYFNNVRSRGVHAAENGNAIGWYVTALSGEKEPVNVQFNGGYAINVTPIGDGDAFRLQNDWTNDCGILLNGVVLNGAKRGAKFMSPGWTFANSFIYDSGYADISAYKGNGTILNVTGTNSSGDMSVEIGSVLFGMTNVYVGGGSKFYRNPDADTSTTGDIIRVIGTNVTGLVIKDTFMFDGRHGVNITGGAQDVLISDNWIRKMAQSAIRFTSTTVSSTDYYPSNTIVKNNILSEIGSTPISLIGLSRGIVTDNLFTGSGTVVGQSSTTNVMVNNNASTSSIGWATDQFGLSSSGQPIIKDGALLTNIQATSIGIDRAAPGNGGGLALQRSANFLYGLLVDNTSAETSARGGYTLQNDLDNTASWILGSSLYSSGTNESTFVGSSNLSGWRFSLVNTNQYFHISVAGATNFTVDKYGTTIRTLPLMMQEITAPSTPPSGFGYFYEKTDGFPYFKNDAGTEYNLASGTTNYAGIALGDLSTTITTGNGRGFWIAPSDGTIVKLVAGLYTASASGGVTIDLNQNGGSILSTAVIIDATEATTITSATNYVLSATNFVAGDIFTMDIDTAGSNAVGPQFQIGWIPR
jgi:hypothetical protein